MLLDTVGLLYAFSAGVFALLSPCGFPMLPGYMLYYLGSKTPLTKAVSSGITCAAGLVTVFSLLGILISTLGSIVSQYVPFLQVGAAVITIIMGISIIAEIKIPMPVTKLKPPARKGWMGVFFYGIAYGLATLGCSAPIFFSIFLYAITTGGLLSGTVILMVYAVGMGLPLVTIAVLVAKAKETMLHNVVRATPWIQKISGILLILIGIYLLYHYATLTLPLRI